jgi:hypothetical protein
MTTVDTENIYFAAVIKRDEGYTENSVLTLLLLENTDKTDSRRWEHVWNNLSVPSTASEGAVATRLLKVALHNMSTRVRLLRCTSQCHFALCLKT